MSSDRKDAILAELTQRYGLQDQFVARLRPALDVILSDEISGEDRLGLLEVLAETSERDLRLRRGTASIERALNGLLGSIDELLRQIKGISGDQDAA